MIKNEKWVAEMTAQEYIAFFQDLYGRCRNDNWNMARRLLKDGNKQSNNFSHPQIVEERNLKYGETINFEKRIHVFLRLSTKNSRYRNLKIEYLKRFGFECEGA